MTELTFEIKIGPENLKLKIKEWEKTQESCSISDHLLNQSSVRKRILIHYIEQDFQQSLLLIHQTVVERDISKIWEHHDLDQCTCVWNY